MYKLTINDQDSYLRVTVNGELNSITDIEIDSDIRRECETREAQLVLIDIRRATTRLSVMENHFAAISYRERMGSDIRAVAIVDKATNLDKSKMYENTAVNRGAMVQFFEFIEDAEAWLRNLSR